VTEQHQNQLREAFETHSHQTPDPAAVYARVEELAGKYRRRRKTGYVAGGAVLGAGLIAGVLNLPTFLPADPANTGSATLPAAAPASAVPSASLGDAELQKYYDAFFNAGYGYDDAVKLAGIWKLGNAQPGDVKAEAGRRLLLGETLPIQPGPRQPDAEPTTNALADKQYAAFFGAGYTWDEAEKLAKIWKIADPSDAKLEAGKRLLAGQELPVKPKPANVREALEQKRVDTFFARGYDIYDAAKLGNLWKISTGAAKAEAGKRLLAGQTLPFEP
jgi:hypothetical protein